MVMRPLGSLDRAAAAYRSKSACSVSASSAGVLHEQRVLGFGIERRGRLVENQQQRQLAHEPARERQLLPLPERRVDAARPGGAQLRLEA